MKKTSLPQHVGIIMDGNRRWARARGLSSLHGHRKGYDQALTIARHAFNRGVRCLTLFAFSTENWNRSKSEVSYLMKLVRTLVEKESKELHAKNIQLKVIGSEDRIPKRLRISIRAAELLTRSNTGGVLLIAFNYGGRRDIVDAIKKVVASKKLSGNVSEKTFASQLSTAGIPDPDLIIRTSGEERLSGFLLWESAYSELYFTKTLWPAFTPKHFDAALRDYRKRKRRFGV